jgi:hypothetical protein
MKSNVLIVGLSTFFPSVALATDLPPAPAPAFIWTGLYVGANVGAWLAPAYASSGAGSNSLYSRRRKPDVKPISWRRYS